MNTLSIITAPDPRLKIKSTDVDHIDSKLQKFMELLEKNTPKDLYGVMISNWKEPADLVNDVIQTPGLIKGGKLWERISA